jgi:hypothetical protein
LAGGASSVGGTGNAGGTATDGAAAAGGSSGSGGRNAAGGRDAEAPDGGGGSDSGVQTVSYIANIADCLEAITQPQLGSCLSFSTLNDGPNELWVDIRRSQHRAFTTYLSFRTDATLANRTIDAVELHVTVTEYRNAAGSGADVWPVVPFDAQSLYTQAPAQVGTTPYAKSPGGAAQKQTVVYSLPATAVTANKSVYLGLFAPTNGDGTGYYGINGDPAVQTPPTLVVTYR